MSAQLAIPIFWAQAFIEGVPKQYQALMGWLYLLGEPSVTTDGFIGALITWVKVISVICLIGWTGSWLATALKERTVFRGGWLDWALVAALVGGVATMFLYTLEENKKVPVYAIASVKTVTLLTGLVLVTLLAWAEYALWSAIRKRGGKADLLILLGVHLAFGIAIAYGFAARAAFNRMVAGTVNPTVGLLGGLDYGAHMSVTYMGYVVLLRVIWLVLVEAVFIRWRRLFSIAKLSVLEANRRMGAPVVVLVIFLVILAFTHWFLQPPRPAELGRLYVGSLSLLCTLLLTVMVTLLTPLSLPQDIQFQTIYTVVSKPVRRIELVWGRMIGFMALVTFLILVFGGISLFYLSRTVGRAITATQQAAIKAGKGNRLTEAKQYLEQADQIRTRMDARVPVYGSLTFLDSKGTAHVKGIDVGQEQSMKEPRSHIEGATPATAIWSFGIVPDPLTPQGRQPRPLNRLIPVASMLQAGTVEAQLDQTFAYRYQIAAAERDQNRNDLPASEATRLTATINRVKAQLEEATKVYEKLKAEADGLEAKAVAAEKEGKATEAQTFRRQASSLHSPPIRLEMTFNIYRTTKGRVGEPVYAELEATNPLTQAQYRNIFPIREYYTNKQVLPASILAGSAGNLKIEIRCISPTQYLGMAESDLFLLSRSGNFGLNFMKGLFGVWLQAMVLTAIGVFAGTFLSWPVALLTTIAFFVAGQLAFSSLLDFTRQSLQGGGPFESLIRLLSHDNLMSELTPTLAVVTAKTLDALVMPVMSRLVYIVPNFAALDVTNIVADGFAVMPGRLLGNLLLALAYAIPFSIAGYFILKNREVAA